MHDFTIFEPLMGFCVQKLPTNCFLTALMFDGLLPCLLHRVTNCMGIQINFFISQLIALAPEKVKPRGAAFEDGTLETRGFCVERLCGSYGEPSIGLI